MKALKIIGWILLILIALAAVAWFGFLKPDPPPISPEDRAQITLMPLPAEMKLGNGVFLLDENFNHVFRGLNSPRLERAVERFFGKFSSQTGIEFGKGEDRALMLECKGSVMKYPAYGDDESYSIKISSKRILLKAATETGIIYGLESLIQLAKERDGQWVLPALTLYDNSRYGWRGLMIDACRHWIPKDVILRNLDAMATVKMNVFHWHLTEHQGFRVESKRFPKLHEMGSNGDFYTQEEIREVLEYAADRGIRVVPEFDIPGHTASWFVGHPELASAPGPYHLETSMMVMNPVMDPTRDEVYDFLDGFFGEMSELFPDDYLHIGGDEVIPTHWNENSDIQDYMKDNGLKDSHALQAHFNIRLQKLISGHGKIMMGWDEILHPDLPKEGIVVQTWRDHGSLWESARLGNKAVLSAGYYLDHKQPASFHYQVDPNIIPGAVDIEVDSNNWKAWDCNLDISEMTMEGSLYLFGEGDELRGVMEFMGGTAGISDIIVEGNKYSFILETNVGNLEFETEVNDDSISGSAKFAVFNLQLTGWRSGGTDMVDGDPLPEFKRIEPLTQEQEANIIGGEACMWSEMVDSVTIESRIWPRAAAVGEKLWSPKVLTDDVKDMYRRLQVFDNRIERLGLKHRSYSDRLLQQMVPEPYLDPLRVLVSVLQEDKMFNRMVIYDPELSFTTPLNRIVDAALPESYVVYNFGQEVGLWLESADAGARSGITQTLETWVTNHYKLAPAIEGSERLKEVEIHSKNLSKLAAIGIEAITDPASIHEKMPEIEALFTSAGESHGGTILPIVEPVQKLVKAATGK